MPVPVRPLGDAGRFTKHSLSFGGGAARAAPGCTGSPGAPRTVTVAILQREHVLRAQNPPDRQLRSGDWPLPCLSIVTGQNNRRDVGSRSSLWTSPDI